MRALVTGAGGFLGTRVVRACVDRGLDVRALVRSGPAASPPGGVDYRRGDLLTDPSLAALLAEVDVVIHLAAQMTGSDHQRFAETVVGTERLLGAMAIEPPSRLVLASSIAVYDWTAARERLTEASPLQQGERDAYSSAKVWQERLVRRACARLEVDLTVLRPGFVWGPEQNAQAGVGQRLGGLRLVVGPCRIFPQTYVENCADCFAAAALDERAAGQTLNLVDPQPIDVWRYAGELRRAAAMPGVRIPVPYWLAWQTVRAVSAGAAMLGRHRLPSLLTPARFEARCKPLVVDGSRLQSQLGWTPPYSFAQALERLSG